MRRITQSILLCAVVALSVIAGSVMAEDEAVPLVVDQPMIGEMAPAFKLLGVNGEEVSSEGLRGSYVVIHFAASW